MKKYIVEFFGNDPINNPDFTRIINERHFDRLCGLMKEGKILCGGKTNKDKLKIEPTVIEGVTTESPIMNEEIFGPLMPVFTFKDISEIYPIINKYPKSLALYLFTKNKDIEKEVMQKVSFGGGCINDILMHAGNSNGQFGGVGNSGMGAYHGKKSFTTLTHDKYVFKKPFCLDMFFRYPPYKDKVDFLKNFMK